MGMPNSWFSIEQIVKWTLVSKGKTDNFQHDHKYYQDISLGWDLKSIFFYHFHLKGHNCSKNYAISKYILVQIAIYNQNELKRIFFFKFCIRNR